MASGSVGSGASVWNVTSVGAEAPSQLSLYFAPSAIARSDGQLTVGSPEAHSTVRVAPSLGRVTVRITGLVASDRQGVTRAEGHTSELQSLMRTSYSVLCLKTKNNTHTTLTKSIGTQT